MNKQTIFAIVIAFVVLLLTNLSLLIPLVSPLHHLVFGLAHGQGTFVTVNAG